jgi:hypothetical protein
MKLPDVLRMLEGEDVQNASSWEQKRRAEVLELFRAHVYGREPAR